MRFLTILFAIYLAALTVVPCDDAWKIDHETAYHQNDNDHSSHHGHNHSHDIENCSPFCACGCCGVQLANYSSQVFFKIPSRIQFPDSKPESLYSKNFISSYSGSIWQPPQLS